MAGPMYDEVLDEETKAADQRGASCSGHAFFPRSRLRDAGRCCFGRSGCADISSKSSPATQSGADAALLSRAAF
jgi:hypothetical protein